MEHRWERTYPFLKVENIIVNKLFEDILEEQNITNVIPIEAGCRTTNYIIETNKFKEKYILKIFFPTEQNYKREIKLLTKLKEYGCVPVPKIYKLSRHKDIKDREYAIYEYIEGKTIGQAIREGYKLEENFVREVARSLAKIHSYKFDKVGFLDENLKIREGLPPLISWYQNFIEDMAKKRLGKIIVDKIICTVKKNEKALAELDNNARLVHGDFQGTNIIIKDRKLVGILDWEFVMAGHPLGDIGQFFRYEEYFDKGLIEAFKDEYDKVSDYKLIDNWYKISKLRDLVNLIQLVNTKENMPIKHRNIKKVIINTLKLFD
jgi:aminoglycoside phosphotransferase (APT) family kinase protein